MKRKDWVLLVFLLLIGFMPFLFFKSEKNNVAQITVDGKVHNELPLDKNAVYIVKSNFGENKVIVEDGCVFVENADCKDKVCVKTGKISKSGEIIACLPHKLLIEVK